MSAYRLSLCEAQHEVFLKPDTLYLFEVEEGCGRCEELASRHTPPMPNAENDTPLADVPFIKAPMPERRDFPPDNAEKGLRRGWFADVDATQGGDYQWQPCLETGQGHIPCFEVWFSTKAECEEWIAANVIGVGWFPGEPTATAPIPPTDAQGASHMPENQPTSAERDAGLRERMEALADEWESVARESKPHLGCLDMHRHLAGELRAALADDTRVIPPESGDRDQV